MVIIAVFVIRKPIWCPQACRLMIRQQVHIQGQLGKRAGNGRDPQETEKGSPGKLLLVLNNMEVVGTELVEMFSLRLQTQLWTRAKQEKKRDVKKRRFWVKLVIYQTNFFFCTVCYFYYSSEGLVQFLKKYLVPIELGTTFFSIAIRVLGNRNSLQGNLVSGVYNLLRK